MVRRLAIALHSLAALPPKSARVAPFELSAGGVAPLAFAASSTPASSVPLIVTEPGVRLTTAPPSRAGIYVPWGSLGKLNEPSALTATSYWAKAVTPFNTRRTEPLSGSSPVTLPLTLPDGTSGSTASVILSSEDIDAAIFSGRFIRSVDP